MKYIEHEKFCLLNDKWLKLTCHMTHMTLNLTVLKYIF